MRREELGAEHTSLGLPAQATPPSGPRPRQGSSSAPRPLHAVYWPRPARPRPRQGSPSAPLGHATPSTGHAHAHAPPLVGLSFHLPQARPRHACPLATAQAQLCLLASGHTSSLAPRQPPQPHPYPRPPWQQSRYPHHSPNHSQPQPHPPRGYPTTVSGGPTTLPPDPSASSPRLHAPARLPSIRSQRLLPYQHPQPGPTKLAPPPHP